jgi:GNAT superfamily N-acetyltransferase
MCQGEEVRIRRFGPADLGRVKALIHKTIDVSYAEAYPPEAIEFFKDYHNDESILKKAEEGYTVVLEMDNWIVGTGNIFGGEIGAVFILPELQGKGYGRHIMLHLEDRCREMGYEAIDLDASLPAVEFYKYLGYEDLGDRYHDVANNKTLDYNKMRKKL